MIKAAAILLLLCVALSLAFMLTSEDVSLVDTADMAKISNILLRQRNLPSKEQERGLSTSTTSSVKSPWWSLGQDYRINIDPLAAANNNSRVDDYFASFGSSTCFLPGVLVDASLSKAKCSCKAGYFGIDCGIPGSVWHLNKDLVLRRRQESRRVVMGVVVNHELDMTEVRLRSLGNLVDVYIIQESNISAAGETKPLFLWTAMSSSGFLSDFWPRLLHVVMWAFPAGFVEDGWKADDYLRTHMSQTGLARIDGLRDDDLFLTFDADELIKPEVLRFLRLYDGYSELIFLNLRWSVYGFYWQHRETTTKIRVGSSIKFLLSVCHNDAILLRRAVERCPGWNDFIRNNSGSNLHRKIGVEGDYGGHHCSWCFPAEGIRLKLLTAQKADKPRWGDYPEKTRIPYIERLVVQGDWFDGSHPLVRTSVFKTRDFAPAFVFDNFEKYAAFLVHPNKRNSSRIRRLIASNFTDLYKGPRKRGIHGTMSGDKTI